MTRMLTVVVLLVAVAVESADAALSVLLVVSSSDGTARIVVTDPKAHFHAVLHNPSSKPMRIWDTTFSWGYYALSLEFVDESGAKHVIRKRQVSFTRNIPRAWLLEPRGYVVLDVYMTDATRWQGLPTVTSDCINGQLTAVYEVARDEESDRKSVWTGRIVSQPQRASLCR